MIRWLTMCMVMGCQDKSKGSTPLSAADTASFAEGEGYQRLAISETSSGKVLVTNGATGTIEGELCLSELHSFPCAGGTTLANPCLMFGTEMQTDGSVLLTYTLREPGTPLAPGAISLVEPAHPPVARWSILNISIPDALQEQERIDCTRDPATPACHLYGAHNTWMLEDGRLLVADTSNSRILWLQVPSEGTTAQVESMLSTSHPQWGSERYPNQVQALDIDGSPHILITFKGHIKPGGEVIDEGPLVLWDLSDPSRPERVWTFPEMGGLAAVHQAWVTDTPDGAMILYAHSRGSETDGDPDRYGSIGFASFNGQSPPEYMADGILPSPGLGFTREVEWDAETNRLLVVDSGCENSQDNCGRDGQILAIDWPSLSPSGQTGAFSLDHAEQTFVELHQQPVLLAQDLRFPFDVDPLQEDQLSELGLCE